MSGFHSRGSGDPGETVGVLHGTFREVDDGTRSVTLRPISRVSFTEILVGTQRA